ncbi:MAG: carboxylate-amine ligase [Caldilineaceae bacterium]|nr:carboxylate-amine ligase [Caldilineaceae bacterium]
MYYPSLNIGIEEEYQLIDPQSRELLGYVTQSMSQEKMLVRERSPDFAFAQRFNQAVLEAGTPVCADLREAREQLLRLRSRILELGQVNNFKVAAAGTHPFSRWGAQTEPLPRFRAMADDAQMIVRRMLAFGLHIHIGVEDRELAVDVMNTMRYTLPHILCLANSSPFWAGRNTGLKSYRSVLLDALPRTGIPGLYNSYQEYRSYVDTLVRTNSIPDASRIFYDILPHHRFPTLVIRICDMLPDYRETLAVTALIQAIVAWMVDLRQRNMSFRIYERTLIGENKWRAVRYGLQGKLIDFGIEQEVPVADLIRELLERVEPHAAQLGTLQELAHIHHMITNGTSADRQVATWRQADGDHDATKMQALHAVVDQVVAETENIQ